MAKKSPSSAARWVVSTRGREEGGGEVCMGRVRNGMLVVEGELIDYCC